MTTNETKIDMINYWIEEIVKYLRSQKFDIDPLPKVTLDETPNPEDELFIKTGYYDPNNNEIVLFVDNRHIKDILRSFCHEMVHRNQNLLDPEGFAQSASSLPLKEDAKLKEIEGEAYLYGNLLFRQFTEQYTH
jgi:hypothetical protein